MIDNATSPSKFSVVLDTSSHTSPTLFFILAIDPVENILNTSFIKYKVIHKHPVKPSIAKKCPNNITRYVYLYILIVTERNKKPRKIQDPTITIRENEEVIVIIIP